MFTSLLEAVAELLLSNEGSIGLAALAVLAIAAPLADRYVIRRKRLAYRVQYNSKIGLSPVDLQDRKNPAQPRELRDLADLLDTMSIVVIRIRNVGPYDITRNEFDTPLEFGFGGRVIWDARISEPSIETHRDSLKNSLQFLPDHRPPGSRQHEDTLAKVRVSLSPRFGARLRRRPNGGQAQAVADAPSAPEWYSVRINGLSMQRKEQFKLVVVLREPENKRDNGGDTKPSLTKDVTCAGHLAGGRVVDEKKQPRLTWRRVTATIGVLLTGALTATLIANASRPDPERAIPCAAGELEIVGSSAFVPALESIAEEYDDACGDADVTTEATGSNAGVRRLATAPEDERGTIAALSDGENGAATPELVPHPVGVIMYTVVVNDSTGIDRLTVGQIRDIYDGRITDWNQLRAGPSMPIRIVGRGQESGSRSTFERTVLAGRTAGELSSNSCESRDRDASASTIRCERGTEEQVLDEVAATEGAIGYVDLPTANDAKTHGQPLTIVQLGGNYPDVANIVHGYPFWAIEYLYTNGRPEDGTALAGFLENLRGGTARAELQDAGYTPCVTANGSLHRLCR